MSDLISRSALLKKICKTFNISEDWDGDIAEPLQTIIDVIENQPIAYDKEAVVEQLVTCDPQEMMSEEQRNVLNYAIEIVRKGGVNDNTRNE